MPVHFISGGNDPYRITSKAFHKAAGLTCSVEYRNNGEALSQNEACYL